MNNIEIEKILAGLEAEVKNDKIDDERDYFLFHKNRFLDLLRRLNKLYKENHKILDIGSRCGHVLMGAKQIGYNAYGCDIEKYCELYRERYEKYNIKNLTCFFPEDKIPYGDNFFDLVLLSETIEHYNFHPSVVFKEISRVLKPGGQVLITTPNLVRLNNRIKILFGESINYDIWLPYNDGIHYREYNQKELVYLLKENGLKVKKIEYIYMDYKDSNLLIRTINFISSFLFKKMRSNIVITGQK
ncbi:MAG: class I SAM-dependent methyltransferase [bacterium]|nr:class I SAM-dependent methyltransferase [bacterium]